MQHQLNIRMDDDLVATSFSIRDASSYTPNVTATNLVLEVNPPDSVASVLFTDVAPGFVKVIDINNLHLNANGILPLPALPDGNYYIRYSVAPNLKIFIAYNYYRTVRLLNKYFFIAADLIKNRSRFTSSFYNKKVQELLWFKQCIDAAKYTAEDLHDVSTADKIYEEINEKLKMFNLCEKC